MYIYKQLKRHLLFLFHNISEYFLILSSDSIYAFRLNMYICVSTNISTYIYIYMYIYIYIYIYMYICIYVRIPLGPTFYIESKNLSSK